MDQFDKLKKGYVDFVKIDAMRNGLHYPEVQRILTEIQHDIRWRILDVGCGGGHLARQLASELGASLTGFDSAPALIAEAQAEEKRNPLGVRYEVARADQFHTDERFDDAVSVLVLPYAKDAADLQMFFRAACEPLEAGGRFISVVFNPEFKAFGERIGNRMFTREEGKSVEVHFLDPRTLQRAFKKDDERVFLTQFSRGEYEGAAKGAGFRRVSWEPLRPSEEAVKIYGKEFWEPCEREQPYAMVIAEK